MKIKYDGTRENILKIMESLPVESRWVKAEGKSITIKTYNGARQVFKGDFIVIEDGKVSIIEE